MTNRTERKEKTGKQKDKPRREWKQHRRGVSPGKKKGEMTRPKELDNEVGFHTCG
jgi:hypothetical protein